eukprot:354050-Chlamydomonas_euryale.AAC.10
MVEDLCLDVLGHLHGTTHGSGLRRSVVWRLGGSAGIHPAAGWTLPLSRDEGQKWTSTCPLRQAKAALTGASRSDPDALQALMVLPGAGLTQGQN